MLKDNNRLYNHTLAILDVLLSLIAFYIAYSIRLFHTPTPWVNTDQYILLAVLIVPTWFILLKIISVQSSQKIKAYSVVFIEYCILIGIGMCILFIYIFAFKLEYISRIVIFIFGLTDLILLFICKVVIISTSKRSFIKGKNNKQIIIIADEGSISLIEKIIIEKHWGYAIFGIVTDSDKIIKKYAGKYQIISINENLDQIMADHIIDGIIYCKNEIDTKQIQHLIYSCGEVGIPLQLQSELFSIIASKSHLSYLEELPVMTFDVTSADHFALLVKFIMEYMLSFISVLIFLPFSFIIAALIKLESKGPVIFKQTRAGLHGRPFTMYKFRTMFHHSDEIKRELENQNEADGPVFKIKNDPRITRIGAFLRKTSLDEFPQFINVLLGDMSVVGPRPPLPEEVALYERSQLRRLSVKPGITCIWQVSGRNKVGFDEWMKLDLQYIDHWSLKLDIMLILKTINAIYKRTGY